MQYNEECIAAESRYKETSSLWLSVEKNVSGLKKAVEEAHRERRYQDLLQWLCSIDHTMMYNTARDNHEDGTNEWLMEDSEFKAWEKNPKSLLWLHGKGEYNMPFFFLFFLSLIEFLTWHSILSRLWEINSKLLRY